MRRSNPLIEEADKRERLVGRLFKIYCDEKYNTQTVLAECLSDKGIDLKPATLRKRLSGIVENGPGISPQYRQVIDTLPQRLEFIADLYEKMGVGEGELLDKTRELNPDFNYTL